MQLCYRGVKYDYHPPVIALSKSEVIGSYRGGAVTFRYPSDLPMPRVIRADIHHGWYSQTRACQLFND
ncbi:MAG: DUF4278 domain-containing protein [Leptolyngbya sp.]|nr:DUF4278 domain-containing protein [Leptolyngbya sp.]